ncbi:MAG: hypothetical protein GY841_22420 [FCB group bacterium]|nr:hypothetical protein [FCB group bacterium]
MNSSIDAVKRGFAYRANDERLKWRAETDISSSRFIGQVSIVVLDFNYTIQGSFNLGLLSDRVLKVDTGEVEPPSCPVSIKDSYQVGADFAESLIKELAGRLKHGMME